MWCVLRRTATQAQQRGLGPSAPDRHYLPPAHPRLRGASDPPTETLMSQTDSRSVLDTPMGDNDANAHTIRDYLIHATRRYVGRRRALAGRPHQC